MSGKPGTAREPKVYIGPVLALLLSIIVLAGLGQLLTGRLKRGLAMVAGQITLMLASFQLFSKIGSYDYFTALLQAGADPGRLETMIAPLLDHLPALMLLAAAALSFYLWVIIDSIVYLIKCEKNLKNDSNRL